MMVTQAQKSIIFITLDDHRCVHVLVFELEHLFLSLERTEIEHRLVQVKSKLSELLIKHTYSNMIYLNIERT